jgi:hypothetical protein
MLLIFEYLYGAQILQRIGTDLCTWPSLCYLPINYVEVMTYAVYMGVQFKERRASGSHKILNHINPNVRGSGQGEAMPGKYKRLKLGSGQAYDRSAE